MKKNRVIVAGGRHFNDRKLLYDTLNRLLGETIRGRAPRRDLEVFSGCAKGADTLGMQWARDNQIPVKRFPALWKLPDGRIDFGAGKARNIEMAKHATHLIAFWDGQSRGTAHMIAEAGRQDLKVRVIRYA